MFSYSIKAIYFLFSFYNKQNTKVQIHLCSRSIDFSRVLPKPGRQFHTNGITKNFTANRSKGQFPMCCVQAVPANQHASEVLNSAFGNIHVSNAKTQKSIVVVDAQKFRDIVHRLQ